MTEQDDMENWNYAHAASRGTIARRYPYSYEQGLGFEVENYEWQGLRIPGTVLEGGAVAEIVSNPADGVWVFARYLSAPDDPTRVGTEEMIFAQDIIEIGEPPP
jgi:hypothetical protein